MLIDQIAFVPDVEALLQRLHINSADDLAVEVVHLVEQARPIARPKVFFKEVYIGSRTDNTITIDGTTFTSHALSTNLHDVGRVFAYVATCGAELDTLQSGCDDAFLSYALDCLKEMALGAAEKCLREHIAAGYGLEATATMHPGSGDADVWPIEQQRELFSLLGDVTGKVGVTLTDSLLMVPNKSTSGIIYPTKENFVTCQLCHRENCPNRRAPFDAHLWHERHLGL